MPDPVRTVRSKVGGVVVPWTTIQEVSGKGEISRGRGFFSP